MKSREIRQSFIDFFASKKHEVVPSASLLPESPNLMFTNAGMNQFVPYFLGDQKAPYPRATDTQKNASGQGKTQRSRRCGLDTYHHTFWKCSGTGPSEIISKKRLLNGHGNYWLMCGNFPPIVSMRQFTSQVKETRPILIRKHMKPGPKSFHLLDSILQFMWFREERRTTFG